jgi:tetratricopeptide (TPR) repeat protein
MKAGWILAGALGAALAAGGAGFDGAAPPKDRSTNDSGAGAESLLDPAYAGANVCGARKRDAGRAPALRLQVAALDADRLAGLDPSGPPLWNNLGAVTSKISTAVPEAQRYFDQGLRLTYAFNHAEAVRSFRKAQRLDPGCAMCFWGEALAFGPNINAPMEAEAVAPALAAVAKAQSLAAGATEKEKVLIAAMARRYSAEPGFKQAAGDLAYAVAMEDAAERFPADDDVGALAAEALMNLSPWDYWAEDKRTPKGKTADTVKILERVLARNPNHPAAIHLYIHAVEASTTPERAEAGSDRLARLMPGSGHLVHMPSHIYYRIGRYKDSLAVNRDAIAADEAYLRSIQGSAIVRGGYYPHNVHFLLVSAQMAGDRATALAAADKLAVVTPDEAVRAFPWVQPIKAAPYFAWAQFHTLERVLDLAAPNAEFSYATAAWRYARGVALALAGDAVRAAAEADAIGALATRPDVKALAEAGIPAGDVLKIAELVVRGRVAQAKGDLEAARRAYVTAAAVQDKLPYMEPPFWYYPVQQSLGAVLLLQGKVVEAERAFEASLLEAPNNGRALYGLREARLARGDTAGADATRTLFDKAWAGDPKDPRLAVKRL